MVIRQKTLTDDGVTGCTDKTAHAVLSFQKFKTPETHNTLV